jgi:hypothetical protein
MEYTVNAIPKPTYGLAEKEEDNPILAIRLRAY